METAFLAKYPYDQVEWLYRRGAVSQAQWEAFSFVWAHSAPRFSSLASWCDGKRVDDLPFDVQAEVWAILASDAMSDAARSCFFERMASMAAE